MRSPCQPINERMLADIHRDNGGQMTIENKGVTAMYELTFLGGLISRQRLVSPGKLLTDKEGFPMPRNLLSLGHRTSLGRFQDFPVHHSLKRVFLKSSLPAPGQREVPRFSSVVVRPSQPTVLGRVPLSLPAFLLPASCGG